MFSFFEFLEFLFGRRDPSYKVAIMYTYSSVLSKVVSSVIECDHKVQIIMPGETVPSDVRLLIVATDQSVDSESIVGAVDLPTNMQVDTMLTRGRDTIKEAYANLIPILALGNGGLFLRGKILPGFIKRNFALPSANQVTVTIPWATSSLKAAMVPPSVVLVTEQARPFIEDEKGNVYGWIKDGTDTTPPIIMSQMPFEGSESFIMTSILNLADYEKPTKVGPPVWVTDWRKKEVLPPVKADIKEDPNNNEGKEEDEGSEGEPLPVS